MDSGNVLGDVLDGNGVFDGEAMALSLQACLVEQDPGVGVQASKGQANVIVY